jgi:preprotein translocase subunit SecF
MELIKPTNINFIGQRYVAFVVSGMLTLGSFACFAFVGFNLGIDFTGGTLIELSYEHEVVLDDLRADLASAGIGDAIVQNFGTTRDVLVRIPPRPGESSAELSTRVLDALPGAEMRRVEFVGPQVGDELIEQGGLAMLYALIGILIYVAVRFETRFAIGAVLATVHDVVITAGALSAMRINFDLTVVAGLLTVIGYSLNDTIVVFDRIRENFRKIRRGDTAGIVNTSVNETLSRTVMTGMTTLMVLAALFAIGGEMLRPFCTTMVLGILFGTYSSIYVASALTLVLGVSRQDLMPVQKEGLEADHRP